MDNLNRSAVEELLTAVGEHVAAAGTEAAIVVVGGSSLAVGGWVDRTTKDVDVIARATTGTPRELLPPEPLPQALRDAVSRVARDYGLPTGWLNTEVGAQWTFGVPAAFAEELDWRRYGALHVGFAGRQSLITLKLFAAADRGPESVHVQDLIALTPTDAELNHARRWVVTQDASEHFPTLVDQVIEHVREHREHDRPAG